MKAKDIEGFLVEKLKEASNYEILKTVAACHLFIKIGIKVVEERLSDSKGGQFVS